MKSSLAQGVASSAPAKPEVPGTLAAEARRAMWSQFLGFGMDAYDMAMVIVLSPILQKIFAPPTLSPVGQFLSVALLYAATMAARPVGGAVFGHFADKLGRRLLLVITIGGVGLMSVACALVPSPETVGLPAAYAIFMGMRFLMGCFFGGEYAVGHTFAIEHAPAHRRGAVGGFVQSGFPMGYALASFAVLGLTSLIGEAAMQQYGWRIMFLTGVAPVGLALVLRRTLTESPMFKEAQGTGRTEENPFGALLRPPLLWIFLQVFFFMTGMFFTDYAVYQFLPKILHGAGKFNLSEYTFIYGVALLCCFLGYNFYGRLSDRFGRRKLTLWYCLYIAVLGVPLYQLLIHAAQQRSVALALVAAVLAGSLKLAWGIVPAYLSERFPTRTRSVGVGFGFSCGAMVGGAGVAPVVALFHQIPAVAAIEGPNELWLSPSLVLTLGAALSWISLWGSPETRGINLQAGDAAPVADQAPPKAEA